MKGYTGFVIGFNHVKHKFQVGLDFSLTQILLKRDDFSEIDRDVDMRSSSPARSTTPIPSSPLFAADDPDREVWLSPETVDKAHSLGEYNLSMSSYMTEYHLLEPPGPQSFLTDEICMRVTTHHIQPALGPGIGHGNRQGHTTIPMLFNNITHPSKILLYFTDNKGRWVKEYRPLSELKPALPATAKKEIIILDSTHKGHIATIFKLKKLERMAIFKVDGMEWHEPLDNLCPLAAHLSIGCNCKREMSSSL